MERHNINTTFTSYVQITDLRQRRQYKLAGGVRQRSVICFKVVGGADGTAALGLCNGHGAAERVTTVTSVLRVERPCSLGASASTVGILEHFN